MKRLLTILIAMLMVFGMFALVSSAEEELPEGTGIKAANYDWDYSAIGYVTINGETVYSTQYATRNIKFVAGEAVKDATSYTEQELEYINTYLQ